MPTYHSYSTKKSDPRRLTRKSERNAVFIYNRKLSRLLKKQRRQEKELREEGV